MPKKRDDNPLSILFDLAAMLPWWVGVGLALVSYVGLHMLASQPPPTVDLKNMGASYMSMVVRAFAGVGQYFVPLIFLAGAIASAWQGRRRRALVNDVAQSASAHALDHMSWHEFEMTVAEAFRLDGFEIEQRGGAEPDGGIDMVLRRDNEKFFVQCKQWKAYKVGVDVVRALYGVMAAGGAAGGFVVTSGRFTHDAQEFASGRNIVLVDAPILLDMIRSANRAPIVNPRNSAKASNRAKPLASQPSCPICPICQSDLVKRIAKRGRNAGQAFWGCSRYPDCKGTRPIG
jgi:restriction system protein